MNGLSVSELCCLFCCPPCPSRIAAKLAFLPPEPTYSLLPDLDGSAAPGTAGSGKWKLHLTERAEFQYSQRELDATEVFFTRSSRGNRVGCMYIRCAPTASFYIGLGTRINCNIFSYDYSGYGVSTGKPSEKNLYADIEAAWQALPLAPFPRLTWHHGMSTPRRHTALMLFPSESSTTPSPYLHLHIIAELSRLADHYRTRNVSEKIFLSN
uniref:Abhydrolase domain containing 17A, depalmitoylase n=1 Tax=Oncorhynchus kisutch TaxID=8019 RepID=A0A8C7JCP9_ONCKI